MVASKALWNHTSVDRLLFNLLFLLSTASHFNLGFCFDFLTHEASPNPESEEILLSLVSLTMWPRSTLPLGLELTSAPESLDSIFVLWSRFFWGRWVLLSSDGCLLAVDLAVEVVLLLCNLLACATLVFWAFCFIAGCWFLMESNHLPPMSVGKSDSESVIDSNLSFNRSFGFCCSSSANSVENCGLT